MSQSEKFSTRRWIEILGVVASVITILIFLTGRPYFSDYYSSNENGDYLNSDQGKENTPINSQSPKENDSDSFQKPESQVSNDNPIEPKLIEVIVPEKKPIPKGPLSNQEQVETWIMPNTNWDWNDFEELPAKEKMNFLRSYFRHFKQDVSLGDVPGRSFGFNKIDDIKDLRTGMSISREIWGQDMSWDSHETDPWTNGPEKSYPLRYVLMEKLGPYWENMQQADEVGILTRAELRTLNRSAMRDFLAKAFEIGNIKEWDAKISSRSK